MAETSYRKKLIEVALPLPEINDASAFDKRPGIGPHPKGIHHWWARLPLPSARAVLFASVVTDPGDDPAWANKTEAAQNAERERLFEIARKLMGKKLHEHPEVYAEANEEMLRHCEGSLPPVLDPFSGGGSIPLEAARLGFPAHAADLNPIAVLLNRCNLELAPHWIDCPPVNPEDRQRIGGAHTWKGTHGLAADVCYYGKLIRTRAVEKIGHLYPRVRLPKAAGGGDADVIAWLWARTVGSQDPAAKGAHVPLLSTFWVCTAPGKLAWIEPIVDRATNTYRFEVRTGTPPNTAAVRAGTKLGRGAKFKSLLSGQPIDEAHIKREGLAGRLGYRLVAIVAEGARTRAYVTATSEHEEIAQVPPPESAPSEQMADDPRNIWCVGYGLKRFDQLFTPRQLTALVTLSDLVSEISRDVERDAKKAGTGTGSAAEYAHAVATFLALALSRCAESNNSLCRWDNTNAGQRVKGLFGRQAIPMLWDFAEANILGDTSVCWSSAVKLTASCISAIVCGPARQGTSQQLDAAASADGLGRLLVSTDPPYYDNISYAGLSDFFYVWLRRSLKPIYPDLFSTVLVPKMCELTASPERFDGDKDRAKQHFEAGFRSAFTGLRDRLDPRFPLTVYYAFKQEDEEESGEDMEGDRNGVDLTTGWETLLEALITSGFTITATWPVRASQKWRMVSMGTNALASYIVLACRARPNSAKQVGRREFLAELKRELPAALRHLQQGNVAPVDFAQAAIGPGMAVFSRYSGVLEANGKPMTVRATLSLINQTLDTVLAEQEGEFDAETRWALAWFEQHGHDDGPFGDAETLSKAKNVGVNGLVDTGVLMARGGKVRLLRREDMSDDWDPVTDERLTVWEVSQHVIRALEQSGEAGAAEVLARLAARTVVPTVDPEVARDLAYRLFGICERKKLSKEAIPYNSLVLAWPDLVKQARDIKVVIPTQRELFQ
ncbi:MAG: DUF1156 domain-containing protein [Lentisphaerae bacterium]|nr:DUF1156 domain-containing protein [Lentisphaerota bacterium]